MNEKTVLAQGNKDSGIRVRRTKHYVIDFDKIKNEKDVLKILIVVMNSLNIRIADFAPEFDSIKEYLKEAE